MRSRQPTLGAVGAAEEDTSSSRSRFGPPIFKSMQVLGDHWVEGKVETHLSRSYRDLVAKGLYYVVVVADREWIIGILVRDSGYVQAYIYLREVFLTGLTNRNRKGCITLCIM
jgi:hypothetical protein